MCDKLNVDDDSEPCIKCIADGEDDDCDCAISYFQVTPDNEILEIKEHEQ